MKKFILLFGLIIACSVIYGQDNRLIYSKNVRDADKRTIEILRESEAHVSVNWVGIDVEKIFVSEQFVLQFGEINLTIQKSRIEERGVNNFSFVGKNKEGVTLVMSVLDGDILGTLETYGGVYSIRTFGENEFAVIKSDNSKMKELDVYDEDMQNPKEFDLTNSFEVVNDGFNFSTVSRNNFDCRIRVLVLYTPAARNFVNNIHNTILHAVDLSNQSFENSNINYRLELAYAGVNQLYRSKYSD